MSQFDLYWNLNKNNSKIILEIFIGMPKYQEHTDTSLNEILEMLKNYRTQGKSKDYSDLEFDSKFNSQHPEDFSSTMYILTNRGQERQQPVVKLHSSLQKIKNTTKQISTIRERLERTPQTMKSSSKSIFNRLYQQVFFSVNQNRQIQKKREILITQRRKSLQKQQIKDCTFSPHIKSKVMHQRTCNLDQIESFYQKNVDWQIRKDNEIKKKQCQKNSIGISNLTFSPKINCFKKKSVFNKQNSQNLRDQKGVQQFLTRQKKAKCTPAQLLENRRKQSNILSSTPKRGYFSYIL